MGKKRQAAREALDYALFGNVFNMRYDEDKWAITFEGDNYVVWDRDSDKLFHFRVSVEDHDWDSAQAIKDQEWFEHEDDDFDWSKL